MATNDGSGPTAAAVVALKVGLVTIAMCIGCYILGPPLYWHLKEAVAATASSSSAASFLPSACPACDCDCSALPSLVFPPGFGNGSFLDCSKNASEMGAETEKNFAGLLSEELRHRETEALEIHRRADAALLEAKKLTSQYQKEADKCNSGMETCEETREKSEAALAAQKKLTVMWESRARQRGWKEEMAKPHPQSPGQVQPSWR
ncbi:hypothetical protein MLD38_003039 [Melastoma candidum]|uniref:Uncharacterized protein n=1 Tax=Melastoma candidum TaxID=119954 RepID=A0ACB9S121_9MYRT|nr:hypothetical protein MLD38_003039 [Melastoma candidum]